MARDGFQRQINPIRFDSIQMNCTFSIVRFLLSIE